uniref:condensation domain-containing protein n=2 Tax=Streptomyces TaxID=1883 RepID=UPI0025712D54
MIGTAGETGADTYGSADAGHGGAEGLPLSPAQERLWFLHQLEPDDASYNIPLVLRLTGALSEPALRAAFDGTAARHEALRTRFPDLDGRPAALVEPPAPVRVESIDLRDRPTDAARLLAERTNAAFDLARGPLLRVSLLRTDEDEHLLCLVLHHIVADGWSLNLLRAELATRYAAHLEGRAVALPELLPYTAYARGEREFAEGGEGSDAEAALAHWRERLAGAPVLDLRPTVAEGAGASGGAFHTRRIAGAGAAVDALARQKRCTPFMVLLAAYQVLLH